MPREGRPPKPTDQARRALIRKATKSQKITLKELQSSIAEIAVSVHRTTLSHTLHRAGLYRRVAKKSPCSKKKISKHVWCSPKGTWETTQTYGRSYSGQMRLKFSFLAIKENAMSGINPTPLITPRTPLFFIGRDWETGQN